MSLTAAQKGQIVNQYQQGAADTEGRLSGELARCEHLERRLAGEGRADEGCNQPVCGRRGGRQGQQDENNQDPGQCGF